MRGLTSGVSPVGPTSAGHVTNSFSPWIYIVSLSFRCDILLLIGNDLVDN